jgi:hypothetical protein
MARTTKYIVTASFERDGQILACTQWETLGDDFGREYASREAAQRVALRLQRELRDTDLDPSTRYEVAEA